MSKVSKIKTIKLSIKEENSSELILAHSSLARQINIILVITAAAMLSMIGLIAFIARKVSLNCTRPDPDFVSCRLTEIDINSKVVNDQTISQVKGALVVPKLSTRKSCNKETEECTETSYYICQVALVSPEGNFFVPIRKFNPIATTTCDPNTYPKNAIDQYVKQIIATPLSWDQDDRLANPLYLRIFVICGLGAGVMILLTTQQVWTFSKTTQKLVISQKTPWRQKTLQEFSMQNLAGITYYSETKLRFGIRSKVGELQCGLWIREDNDWNTQPLPFPGTYRYTDFERLNTALAPFLSQEYQIIQIDSIKSASFTLFIKSTPLFFEFGQVEFSSSWIIPTGELMFTVDRQTGEMNYVLWDEKESQQKSVLITDIVAVLLTEPRAGSKEFTLGVVSSEGEIFNIDWTNTYFLKPVQVVQVAEKLAKWLDVEFRQEPTT